MIELKDVVDDVRSKVRLCDLCFPEPSLEHSDDSLRGHSLLFSLVFSPQDKTSFQTQPFLHVASDHDVVSRLRDCDPVSLATKGEKNSSIPSRWLRLVPTATTRNRKSGCAAVTATVSLWLRGES